MSMLLPDNSESESHDSINVQSNGSVLISHSTASFALQLATSFLNDSAEIVPTSAYSQTPSMTFLRGFFDPLWTHLKESPFPWRYERDNRLVPRRTWCFVPPKSEVGIVKRGVCGVDFYDKEEQLALAVLEEVMERLEDSLAVREMCQVLQLAVNQDCSYEQARKRRAMGTGRKTSRDNRRKSERTRNRKHSENPGSEKSWKKRDRNVKATRLEATYRESSSSSVEADSGSEENTHRPRKKYHKSHGWNNPESGNSSEYSSNNLVGVIPKVGMPLEVQDQDFIWSAAKIVRISHNENTTKDDLHLNQQYNVTIRYEGWGEEWDEEVPYSSSRLARIFTYTKKVKCLLVVLSRKDKISFISSFGKKEDVIGSTSAASFNNIRNWTDIWPCTVSFRMPHPHFYQRRVANDEKSPEELLRLESNIFVQPYSPHLLSSLLQEKLMYGGIWVSASNLVLWKDFDTNRPIHLDQGECVLRELNPGDRSSQDLEYYFRKGFFTAYQAALSDQRICGFLPPNAISRGSLVSSKYRTKHVGGESIDGVKYTGEFNVTHDNFIEESSKKIWNQCSLPSSASNLMKTKSIPSVIESSSLKHTIEVSPPILPEPIPITDLVYPKQGIKRLPFSNRWASTVSISGNDVFLGSFGSQTEAMQAKKLALSHANRKSLYLENSREGVPLTGDSSKNSKLGTKSATSRLKKHRKYEVLGPLFDLHRVPVESVISAYEEASDSQKRISYSFQLHDWVVQHYKYVQYQLNSVQRDNKCFVKYNWNHCSDLPKAVDAKHLFVMSNNDSACKQSSRKQAVPKRRSVIRPDTGKTIEKGRV